jgi:hypothetical protein
MFTFMVQNVYLRHLADRSVGLLSSVHIMSLKKRQTILNTVFFIIFFHMMEFIIIIIIQPLG